MSPNGKWFRPMHSTFPEQSQVLPRPPKPGVVLHASKWRWLVPETIALVLAIVGFDKLFLKSGAGFDPILLWIPVALMSAQYGVLGGLFAATISAVALLTVGMPPQEVGQDFYAYAAVLAGQPSAWVLYALTIGGLRSLQMIHAANLEAELTETHEAAEKLGEGLERSLFEIGRLEARIASETGTLDAVVRSLARLDLSEPQVVMKAFADVLVNAAGIATLTLYRRTPAGFEPVVRRSAGHPLDAAAPAKLSCALTTTLLTAPRDIMWSDADGPELLPVSTVLVAPIVAGSGAGVLGVILVERLRQNYPVDAMAQRVHLLAPVLANILFATRPARSPE
jgi:hypothetical protein